jgi:deoxycytidylate deaminase
METTDDSRQPLDDAETKAPLVLESVSSSALLDEVIRRTAERDDLERRAVKAEQARDRLCELLRVASGERDNAQARVAELSRSLHVLMSALLASTGDDVSLAAAHKAVADLRRERDEAIRQRDEAMAERDKRNGASAAYEQRCAADVRRLANRVAELARKLHAEKEAIAEQLRSADRMRKQVAAERDEAIRQRDADDARRLLFRVTDLAHLLHANKVDIDDLDRRALAAERERDEADQRAAYARVMLGMIEEARAMLSKDGE